MPLGSRVRLISAADHLPATLRPQSGQIGVVVGWENVGAEKAEPLCMVDFGTVRLLVAAGHLQLEARAS